MTGAGTRQRDTDMRFRKGTTDHDGDGKMGGSMKETDMANAPKKAAAKPAQSKTTTKATDTAESGHKAQNGMEPGLSPKEQRAALNAQFEAADEKGQAAIIDETQAGLGVRGY